MTALAFAFETVGRKLRDIHVSFLENVLGSAALPPGAMVAIDGFGSMSGAGMTDFERLSPRHCDCLRLVYHRCTSKEIARELGIGPGTVDGYLGEAIAILGARHRREAAAMLHAHEFPGDPGKLPPQFSGVAQAPGPIASRLSAEPPSPSPPATTWRHNHAVRSKGAACNGLNPARRILWILRITFSCAAGLGAVVYALEGVSRLFFSR